MSQKEISTPPQKVALKYEVEGQVIEVELKDVRRFLSDIKQYDEQFSVGASLARMLLESFGKKHPNELIQDESENQEITAFFLLAQHKDTLDKIGLSLEPVSSDTAIITEGAEVSQKQVALNLRSKEHFIGFLNALNLEQVNSMPEFRSDLAEIPDIFSQQILKSYNLLSPEQEAIELFSGMEKIIQAYKRLDLPEAVEKLENYYEHGMTGDLREYVAIEKKGLLSKPGENFGPADWQIDSTPDSLERRWNGAVAILELIKQNPKAEELYKQLVEHLQMCIKLAIQSLDETISHYDPSVLEKFRIILEAEQQKIAMIAASSSSEE